MLYQLFLESPAFSDGRDGIADYLLLGVFNKAILTQVVEKYDFIFAKAQIVTY